MRWGIGTALLLIGLWLLPFQWCARQADDWYAGDADLQKSLVRGVESWLDTPLGRSSFTTGSSRFDGEWLFGTYMMAGMGLAQTAIEHPEWREHHVALMHRCIEQFLLPKVRAFDVEAWGEDPFETLGGPEGHAAFLGYFNLLLSFHRQLAGDSVHADLNDRITEALARRLEASPLLLIQSYPGEVYPVDNCAVIASIAMYDRATGADHGKLIDRWLDRCRSDYVDRRTGLLIQAIDYRDGQPIDYPRGSGTCLGLYFLSFADPQLSSDLHDAVKQRLMSRWFRFGVVREYPADVSDGAGDIDSGPIVLGYGVSPTGFAMAGARIHGHADQFRHLYATAHLFGAPLARHDQRNYVAGGPLGDAILLAMLTAQPRLTIEQKP